MKNLDLMLENRERGPVPTVLVIESDPKIVKLYQSLFMEKMGITVNVVPPMEAITKKFLNVSLIIVEPPRDYTTVEYVRELRIIYPNQHILIASGREDILTDIKDPKLFPNVSAMTKPFNEKGLNEFVEFVTSENWPKKTDTKKEKFDS